MAGVEKVRGLSERHEDTEDAWEGPVVSRWHFNLVYVCGDASEAVEHGERHWEPPCG